MKVRFESNLLNFDLTPHNEEGLYAFRFPDAPDESGYNAEGTPGYSHIADPYIHITFDGK